MELLLLTTTLCHTEPADAYVIPHCTILTAPSTHRSPIASLNQSRGTSSTRYYCQTLASFRAATVRVPFSPQTSRTQKHFRYETED
ncbi:hypothetical protein TNCV_501391 [Trichonephila clavipes]|nr:hypothetical protein TNCV_501391 [Trichonephila clavipes]